MEQTDIREGLIHDSLHALIHVSRMHHRNIDRIGQEADMNCSPCMLLMQLNRFGELPSQRELADHFDISPACIARSLKSLVSSGFVARNGSSEDMRRNQVQITEKWRAQAQIIRESFHAFDQTIFDGMTNEEIETLRNLLNKIERNIRAVEEKNGCAHHTKGSVEP
ncbi:MAG: winged helix-turn-helix transcriptional regulator [Clostridia bacterium]|nr:winged helix-turn-helix transcriptional regulator [Clostridia bacterium]